MTTKVRTRHMFEIRNLYAKFRLEKSFFGYDPSVLKSGIQKYARRAEVEKGLWCLVEMDLFSLLEWGTMDGLKRAADSMAYSFVK